MKKLLEEMSRSELKAMLWRARCIRFKGGVRRITVRILAPITLIVAPSKPMKAIAIKYRNYVRAFSLLTCAVAWRLHTTHANDWPLIAWTVWVIGSYLWYALFIDKPPKEPNAHWVTKTQPRKLIH